MDSYRGTTMRLSYVLRVAVSRGIGGLVEDFPLWVRSAHAGEIVQEPIKVLRLIPIFCPCPAFLSAEVCSCRCYGHSTLTNGHSALTNGHSTLTNGHLTLTNGHLTHTQTVIRHTQTSVAVSSLERIRRHQAPTQSPFCRWQFR